LTGHIPFSGTTYEEIIDKNTKSKINFDFSKYNITVTPESRLTSYGSFAADATEEP
jgi:hypothetical protein